MTKAEQRKMARLEAENAALRDRLARIQSHDTNTIRKSVAYEIAMREVLETIREAQEFAA